MEADITGKRQVTFLLDEDELKKMEKLREETGISVSRQLELLIKGYKIIKVKRKLSKKEQKTQG